MVSNPTKTCDQAKGDQLL